MGLHGLWLLPCRVAQRTEKQTHVAQIAHTLFQATRRMPATRTLLPPHARRWAAWALVLGMVPGAALPAAPLQTVCTITVNSADEKDAFKRHLPAGRYRFVELVEQGRRDWLARACQAAIRCDVLVVSGHYDGHNHFFSDQLEEREFLPVDELERVSCSDSCSDLFAQLKEVHLYGCNTLNTDAQSSATAEVVRSLVREGHSLKSAEQQLRALNAGHGESSRDRMRQVFKGVPVIYGFSSVAPLGPVAAAVLDGHFRSRGTQDTGRGRASPGLLARFAPFSMSVAAGTTERDPQAPVRESVCRFVDDRLTDAERLGFVHRLLDQDMAQARVHLDRIRRFTQALEDPLRQTAEVAQALDLLAADTDTRSRFLAFARDADQPAVRARMLKVAGQLGWLSDTQRRHELTLMLDQVLARSSAGPTELDLACTLNQEQDLDGAFAAGLVPGRAADGLTHTALRACLGSTEDRTRTVQGLLSTRDDDVRVAQAYLRHRPLTDPAELRLLAAGIARMPASPAQVRALEVLGRHYVADRQILDGLVRLYSQTPSPTVQTAIAGILMRADRRAIPRAELLRTLVQHRRVAAAADPMTDALLRRLRSP